MRSVWTFWLLALCLVLCACSRKQEEQPTYTSHLSEAEALLFAGEIAELVDGTYHTVADSGSMRPVLHSQVFVVVVPDYDRISKDSIVLFHWLDELVIHQAFKQSRRGWYMNGINNMGWDQFEVNPDNYFGTVVAIVPFRK